MFVFVFLVFISSYFMVYFIILFSVLSYLILFYILWFSFMAYFTIHLFETIKKPRQIITLLDSSTIYSSTSFLYNIQT